MIDSLTPEWWALALLLVVLALYRRVVAFLNLTKLGLRAGNWAPVSWDQAPAHVRYLLAQAGRALGALGFERQGSQAGPPMNRLDPRALVFADLYWHPRRAVLARVELAEPLTGQVTRVLLISLFEDRRALLTVNRELWASLPEPPQTQVQDAYGDDLDSQWRLHLDTLAARPGPALPVGDPLQVLRWQVDAIPGEALAQGQALGWLRQDAPGHYRFTAKGAWWYAGRLARPSAEVRRALTRPYQHDPAPARKAARLAEMDGLAAHIALAAEPLPAWMKGSLFLVTLALSAALFGSGFGVLDAAALLMVLLIHELGHLAAMAACGYRNLSIFFLPLLGAAAKGHKPDAPPWQEALVLLAGPVTGLLATLVLAMIPVQGLPPDLAEFLRAAVLMGLVLNLFNLLPIGMLDGGRLVELALLGRFPFLRAGFALVGVLVGIGFAIWAESPLLAAAMGLLMFSMPLQFKAARAIRSIRSRVRATGLASLDGEQAIRALGREFARDGYGGNDGKGWARRVAIAKLVYPRLRQGVPSLGLSLGVAVAQLAALALPLVVVTWDLRGQVSLPLL